MKQMTLVHQRAPVLLGAHGGRVDTKVEQVAVESTVASDSKRNSMPRDQEAVVAVVHFESLLPHDSKHCQPMDSAEELRSRHFVQQRNC